MKSRIAFLWMAALLIALQSCKKKQETTSNEQALGSFTFTSEELAIIPYPTYDTLIFRSTAGDSIVFLLNGRRTTDSRYYKYPENPSGYKGDYYTSQEVSTGFGSKANDFLAFHLSFSDPFKEKSGTKYFSISLMHHSFEACSWYATFRFAADTIMSYLPDTSFTNGGYVKSRSSQMLIGPLMYKGVYDLRAPQPSGYCLDYVNRLFYSISEGVQGFSLYSGKTYYLLPRKAQPPSGATIPGAYMPNYPMSFWTYLQGTVESTVRTSSDWLSFQGSTITTVDGKYMKKYLQYYDYGGGEIGWTPLLSENVGEQWEFDLGPQSGNPWTRVTRVMQKSVDTHGDSVIVLRSYTYHKNPLTTNSHYTWQTYKKNIGLVKESMIDTATGQILYTRMLTDYYINR